MRITRYMAGEDMSDFLRCTSNGSVRQKVRREDGIVLAAVLWNCNCILSAYVSYEKEIQTCNHDFHI